MIFQVCGVEVGTKNQSKIEAQDGSPLGIDFWWIWVVFGRQVGREHRAKSEQTSIQKRIEKMLKNMCVLEAAGGEGGPRAGRGEAAILGPSYGRFSKNTMHRTQSIKNIYTRHAC